MIVGDLPQSNSVVGGSGDSSGDTKNSRSTRAGLDSFVGVFLLWLTISREQSGSWIDVFLLIAIYAKEHL